MGTAYVQELIGLILWFLNVKIHVYSLIYELSDAIQPSHPLSSPSPPAFNLSQHQGLFK